MRRDFIVRRWPFGAAVRDASDALRGCKDHRLIRGATLLYSECDTGHSVGDVGDAGDADDRVLDEERFPWLEGLGQVHLLSERELQVFSLLSHGYSNREIAAFLGVTERTVKAHMAQILAKLRVESRLQAGLVAFAHGLTGSPTPPPPHRGAVSGGAVSGVLPGSTSLHGKGVGR
ncbi:two-component response regulator VraR [Streptomyces mobaraensis NBRC 13819 = DSM 40847]|uniref:Two-component response regulator VraR n=1 Tax=Streptomyces mobaraensis (strain ATCC 29032 / DSM 40847 / JCM 4168 / NBRC 13819 / NCIMB 11159 / IPCR 16-22) TaxID=1223523 RepID=M3B6H2_STRM1|nr:two-component response regulator VraR [Streptomyces mobaraensis NBRC 13819 = DSM 40847]